MRDNAMLQEPGHLSDEEILLVLDGESGRSLVRKAHAHLAACWGCRARMAELEATIKEFTSGYRRSLEPIMPDPKGPTALLKARLSEAAAESSPHSFAIFWRSPWPARTLAVGCGVIALAVFGSLLWKQPLPHQAADGPVVHRTVPDHKLTPGATRPVSLREVCSMRHEEVVHDVPGSLRERVFQEYGIVNPRLEDFEVDYLIAPGLGGTDDIRNLWPEPSTPSAWNAHKKDALEERLHQLVCSGELDLTTAQQAISNDWITAYEKYCQSDQLAEAPARRLRRTEKDSATG